MNKRQELEYLKHRINVLENGEDTIIRPQPKQFRTLLFIVLLVLFWPAALVYAVYFFATKDKEN